MYWLGVRIWDEMGLFSEGIVNGLSGDELTITEVIH